MENKNNKLVIFLLIVIICLLAGGGFLVYTLLSDKPNSNVGSGENNNQYLSGEENNNEELNELIGKYVAVSSDLNDKEYFILNSDGTVNIYRMTGNSGAYANITTTYSVVTENGKKVLKFDLESQSWNVLDAVKTNNGYKFIPREVGPSATDLTFEKEN